MIGEQRAAETIENVLDRCDQIPSDDKGRIVLAVQTLFGESAALAALQSRREALYGRVAAELVGPSRRELAQLHDLFTRYWLDASQDAVLMGYALGRTEGLPEAMRVAAAKAYAGWAPAVAS